MPRDIQDRISHSIDTAIDTRLIPTTILLDNKIDALSAAQATSADLVVHTIQRIGENTTLANQVQALESRAQSLSLRRKLNQVDASTKAIQTSLQILYTAQHTIDPNMSKSEVKKAMQNILHSIWLLLSSLHLLIRGLMYVSYLIFQSKLMYMH
jgi:hypothetical protein